MGIGDEMSDAWKRGDWRGALAKGAARMKQVALDMTDLEVKTEEATNNDKWGPHGSLLTELAQASGSREGFREIMGVLDERFKTAAAHPEKWRLAYKALLVLEHLVKHGDGRVVDDLRRDGPMRTFLKLTKFDYKDADMRDHGLNVRNRAQLLRDLLQNPDRIREEREKARSTKGKYTGVSSSAMLSSGGGGGFGSSDRSGPAAASQWDSQPAVDVSAPKPAAGAAFAAFPEPAAPAAAAAGGFEAAFDPPAFAAPAPAAGGPQKKSLSQTKVNSQISAGLSNAFGQMSAPAPPAPAAAAPAGGAWAAFGAEPGPAAPAVPAAVDPFAAINTAPAPAASVDPFAALSAPAAPAAADPFVPAAPAAAPAIDVFQLTANATPANPFANGAPAAAAPAGFGAFPPPAAAGAGGFGAFNNPAPAAMPPQQPAMGMGMGMPPPQPMGMGMPQQQPAMGFNAMAPQATGGMDTMFMSGPGMNMNAPTVAVTAPSVPPPAANKPDPFADLLK